MQIINYIGFGILFVSIITLIFAFLVVSAKFVSQKYLKIKDLKIVKFWKYGVDLRITKNKNLAIEVNRYNWIIFLINFQITNSKIDHHGICLRLTIFGFSFEVELYDSRHSFDELYPEEEFVEKVSSTNPNLTWFERNSDDNN